jgi:HEAT repeat protein
LGRIGAEAREAVPELVNMLRRHEWPHNAYAAAALGGIGPDAKSAVPALVQVIRNTNTHPDAKGTAIKSLGRIGPAAAAAVPVLAEETASATGCRREAAQALGEIGSREGVPALIALLRSGDAALCYDAAKALGRIGAAAAEAVPELTVVSKREYDHTLAGEEASAALWRITGKPDEVLRLLASDDWRRRCFAACRLAELGPSVETAIPHLEKALGDKNERVRQASAEAMRKIKAAQEKDK